MYCDYCGVELNDSAQTVCENCGSEVSSKDVEIKTHKEPLLTKDNTKENVLKRVRRRRCC